MGLKTYFGTYSLLVHSLHGLCEVLNDGFDVWLLASIRWSPPTMTLGLLKRCQSVVLKLWETFDLIYIFDCLMNKLMLDCSFLISCLANVDFKCYIKGL
jgi:hypothetical protein